MSDNNWPKDAPKDAPYYAFTVDHDEDAAAERFRQKHGRQPEWLFESGDGYLRVGPCGEPKERGIND